uniref:Uncharacterized protein n=1 Tax=Clandestinovirus TaxID=2831644 RepID=A0A8F8KQ57_9VIRU|nr:hypothetical protein KOM_12_492 [Clandestinovirus]
MSTPEQRGFDDQFDINASQTLRDGVTVACDNNGQCGNTVQDGFPYVEGTTMPCSYANCGIPDQPFEDQKSAMMQGGMQGHAAAQMADRMANGVIASGYEYFEDPYYMEAVEDGKVLAGSFPERHLVLQDDFNNDSIVPTMSKEPITQFEAADKFIASESALRNPMPVAGSKDALLAQQAASQTASYKKSMLIGGYLLGAGVVAVLGYYGYKKYKASKVERF